MLEKAVFPAVTETSYDWLGFIGRLHPLLVHLPIGFIFFLAAIEMAACCGRFKDAVAARRLLILLIVISVVITAGCGWILSGSDEYSVTTLSRHKWLGTSLVPAVAILWVVLNRGSLRAYRIVLASTVALLLLAGHLGGVLVRGEDYLLPKPRGATAKIVGHSSDGAAASGSREPTIFGSLIRPFFDDYCIPCHGSEKSKAKLRLDAVEYLLKGSESGPVIQPGAAAQSLLMKRLLLPLDEDEHMPPKGKKQPSVREIAWLKWWIDVGAPLDKTISELKIPKEK